MLQSLKLLLPVLVPSWRFFDAIAPSPRIEFALLKTADAEPSIWQEFRPRPARLSFVSMLKRLFWNPEWNETLFLVSCAERLMQGEGEYASQEILQRIQSSLKHAEADTPYLQFRLVFVTRDVKEITFVSPVHRMGDA